MASDTQENGAMKLNEEYLAELEEAAKGRYTEEDESFMKVFSNPPPKPPILPAEQFNRNRFRGNRHRGHRGRFQGNWQDRSGGSGDGRYGGGYRDRSNDGRYGGDSRDRSNDGRYGGDNRDRRQDYRSQGYGKRDWRGEGRDHY